MCLCAGLALAGCDRLANAGRTVDQLVDSKGDTAPPPPTTVNIKVLPASDGGDQSEMGTRAGLIGAWSVDNDLCGGEDNFIFDANGDWSGGPWSSGRWQSDGQTLTINIDAVTQDMMGRPLPAAERMAATRLSTSLEWNGPDQIRVQLGSPNGPSTMNRCRTAGVVRAVRPSDRADDAQPDIARHDAPPAGAPAPVSGGGYYAVFASIPVGRSAADATGAMTSRLSSCGIAAHIDRSDRYPGWTPGLEVVMTGPFRQRAEAIASLSRAAGCGITGYLKVTD